MELTSKPLQTNQSTKLLQKIRKRSSLTMCCKLLTSFVSDFLNSLLFFCKFLYLLLLILLLLLLSEAAY